MNEFVNTGYLIMSNIDYVKQTIGRFDIVNVRDDCEVNEKFLFASEMMMSRPISPIHKKKKIPISSLL